jgi:hypothetical protein
LVAFWGERRPSYPNRSYDPYTPYRRQQVYESIKPPAARKTETPPAETVVVVGDSFGEWLAYGLEQVFAETPQIGIVRKIKTDFGLVRDDARLDAPEWMQAIKDLLPATEKANAIVVMLGVNDRSLLRERAPAAKEATSPSDAHPGRAPATAAPRTSGVIPIGPAAIVPKIAKLHALDCPDSIQRRSVGELGTRWCGKR